MTKNEWLFLCHIKIFEGNFTQCDTVCETAEGLAWGICICDDKDVYNKLLQVLVSCRCAILDTQLFKCLCCNQYFEIFIGFLGRRTLIKILCIK